jgi:hypothetical protein
MCKILICLLLIIFESTIYLRCEENKKVEWSILIFPDSTYMTDNWNEIKMYQELHPKIVSFSLEIPRKINPCELQNENNNYCQTCFAISNRLRLIDCAGKIAGSFFVCEYGCCMEIRIKNDYKQNFLLNNTSTADLKKSQDTADKFIKRYFSKYDLKSIKSDEEKDEFNFVYNCVIEDVEVAHCEIHMNKQGKIYAFYYGSKNFKDKNKIKTSPGKEKIQISLEDFLKKNNYKGLVTNGPIRRVNMDFSPHYIWEAEVLIYDKSFQIKKAIYDEDKSEWKLRDPDVFIRGVPYVD